MRKYDVSGAYISPCVTNTVKIIASIVLLFSIGYLAACSWVIGDILGENDQYKNRDENVFLVCISVSIITCLLKIVTSLGLICTCGDHFKKTSYSWIGVQMLLLCILLVGFSVRFAYYDDQGLDEYKAKIADMKVDDSESAWTLALILSGVSTLVGGLAVGLTVGFGTRQ